VIFIPITADRSVSAMFWKYWRALLMRTSDYRTSQTKSPGRTHATAGTRKFVWRISCAAVFNLSKVKPHGRCVGCNYARKQCGCNTIPDEKVAKGIGVNLGCPAKTDEIRPRVPMVVIEAL